MADELRPSLERVRQQRAAAKNLTGNGESLAGARDASGRGAVVAGCAVFDVVTGLGGEVTGAGTADGLQRGDVRVALEDGRMVIRTAGSVILRPRPPAARANGDAT